MSTAICGFLPDLFRTSPQNRGCKPNFMGFLRLQSGAIGDGRRFPKGWEGFGAALTACEFDVGPGACPRRGRPQFPQWGSLQVNCKHDCAHLHKSAYLLRWHLQICQHGTAGASTRPTLEQLISAFSKGPEGFENPHKQRKAEAFSCLGFRNGLSQRSSRK